MLQKLSYLIYILWEGVIKDSDIFFILTTGNPKMSHELVSMPSYMTVVESLDKVIIVVLSGNIF